MMLDRHPIFVLVVEESQVEDFESSLLVFEVEYYAFLICVDGFA